MDYTQPLCHFLIQKSSSGAIGLDPFSVNYKLRDGPFAGFLDNFLGGSGGRLNVDFLVGNIVLGEESLGLAAIRTPYSGVDSYFHMLLDYDRIFALQKPKNRHAKHVPTARAYVHCAHCRCSGLKLAQTAESSILRPPPGDAPLRGALR